MVTREPVKTNQSSVIRKLWFAQSEHGYAVGTGDAELFHIGYGQRGQYLKTLDDARNLAFAIVDSFNAAAIRLSTMDELRSGQ